MAARDVVALPYLQPAAHGFSPYGRRTIIAMIEGPVPPHTAPTVSVDPASPGLITAATVINVEATDEDGFTRIILAIEYPSLGTYELVHDGSTFTSNYSAGSTRGAISNGYQYALMRTGGWPANLTLKVFAIDAQGGERASTFTWTVVADVTPPSTSLARSIDARTLEIVFNEAVVESEALIAANYVITNPALTVTAVVKMSDSVYRLTTSKQTIGEVYDVTVSNIHDLHGNLI